MTSRLKDALFRWLGRSQNRARGDAAPLPKKILLFSHDSKLGDAITHTAFIREVVDAIPGIELHVTTAAGAEGFWRHDSRIRRAWPVPRKGFFRKLAIGKALRRENFDMVLCWDFHRSLTSILLLRLARARCNVGFNKPGLALFDHSIDIDRWAFHVTEKSRRALAILGIHRPNEALRYSLGFPVQKMALPASAGPWIFVNLFSSTADRSFSPVAAESLLKALLAAMPDCRVLLNQPPENQPEVAALLPLLPPGRVTALAPEPDPFHIFGAVAACDYVLSPDTALVHLGAALDKPTLALFLDAPHARAWAPRSTHSASLTVVNGNRVESLPASDIISAFAALRQRASQGVSS
jgi:ADP-heptose:LPS heptosyltransferase